MTELNRSSVSETCQDDVPRLLDERDLVVLRNAIIGSIFESASDRLLNPIETVVKIAAGVYPKFFAQFIESLSETANYSPTNRQR